METHATSFNPVAAPSLSARWKESITLFVLGTVFVFGVGLANADAVHNAAHDVRHAVGFPCH